jgi:hypothetical protein
MMDDIDIEVQVFDINYYQDQQSINKNLFRKIQMIKMNLHFVMVYQF